MIYAIVTVLVLIADQLLKYWTVLNITQNVGSKPLIDGVLSLVYIQNTGAAFGILEGKRWLFIIIAAAFVAFVVFALMKGLIRAPLGKWSMVLVMAGAIGNCIDRVMNGYVVDMFKFEFMNYAIFNLADIFITVCGVLFCIYIIFGKDDKKSGGDDYGEDEPAPRSRKHSATRSGGSRRRADVDEDVRSYEPKGKGTRSGDNPFADMDDLTATGRHAAPPRAQRSAPRSEPVRVPPKYSADEIAAARAAVAAKDPNRYAAEPTDRSAAVHPVERPRYSETAARRPVAEPAAPRPVSGDTTRRAPAAESPRRTSANLDPTMRRPAVTEQTAKRGPVTEATGKLGDLLENTLRRSAVSQSTMRRPAVTESTMRRPVVTEPTARKPAAPAKPKDPMEFTLDDILAEYGDK